MAKDLNKAMLLDYYGDFLTDKQLDIMQLYYDEDMSLTEIAEHLKITRQGVRDAIKRSEDTLIDIESKIGLVGKREHLIKTVNHVKDMMNDVSFLMQGNVSAALEGKLGKIQQALEGLLNGI